MTDHPDSVNGSPAPTADVAHAALLDRLRQVASGNLGAWHGLPALTPHDLSRLLGAPVRREAMPLGLVAATRLEFTPPASLASLTSLVAWVRDQHVIMLELQPTPSFEAVTALGPPDQMLPSELRVDQAIAPEYFYATRGILLTVRDPFDPAEPKRVLRLRLIRAQDPSAPLEPGIHASRANRIDFGGAPHG